MKKFFSLVLALVMVLSLTTVAWGATPTTHTASTLDELATKVAAANEGDIIDLVPTSGNGFNMFVVNDTVAIDPAKKITIDATGIPEPFKVTGKLTLGENVTIKSDDGIIGVYGTGELVVNGATIYHTGGNDYVAIDVAGGTVTVNEKSTIYKVNGIPVSVSGTLNVAGGTIYSDGDDHVAVVVNATGVVNMTDGHVYATDSSAILAKDGGEVTISGGKVEAMKENPAFCAAFARNGGKITVTGTAVVDAAAGYGLVAVTGGEVTVAGGTVDGVKAHEAASAKATITGGIITGDVVAEEGATVSVSGGTFSTDVSAYVADGKQQLANGSVVTTPAAGATDPVLYVWDKAATDWATYYIATGADLDDLKQDASDNCLPCYLIDGEYFVETAEAAATYKLVYGAKTVYLAPVPASKVCYSDKASVLTVVAKTDAECGDYWVADATYDEDDVYYISYDKKGDIDGIWVKAKNGSEQILVNGKIVDADVAGYVDFMFHEWAGHDIVNYQYTTVKCENCDKVAKLYATATAAGKKAQPVGNGIAGYITYADYTDFGANAPVVDTKVESAETFDAGIAMYVGMSVMAAAGSAVVLKKREH